jgi:hypothetical protein
MLPLIREPGDLGVWYSLGGYYGDVLGDTAFGSDDSDFPSGSRQR